LAQVKESQNEAFDDCGFDGNVGRLCDHPATRPTADPVRDSGNAPEGRSLLPERRRRQCHPGRNLSNRLRLGPVGSQEELPGLSLAQPPQPLGEGQALHPPDEERSRAGILSTPAAYGTALSGFPFVIFN